MQNDDITWSILNKHQCSYKIKTATQSFCRNEYNLTGLCMRRACPLANSQYATIREHKGVIYLYIRHAERVYTPRQQWMKVKLSKTFMTALQQIEDNLVFWPQYFKQKCRQRLLKITQYLTRMRKMKLHDTKKLVPVRRKEERRLAKREEKALIAAKLDFAIEKQLLERLKEGTYERIYNFPKKVFDNCLNEKETEEEYEVEDEDEREMEEEEEEEHERETVRVKDEEENMEEELREELERGLVREHRAQDTDSEEEDGEDSDVEEETDEEEESHDEERDEQQQIEYVADFEESDEEPEIDIEDAADRLIKSKGKKLPAAPVAAAENGSESSDDGLQDEVRRKKYNPDKTTKPVRKFKLKKLQAKRKLRALYEKEKAAKEARRIRVRK